jgi:TRAP-type C4-dicarboxylate transport system permease small subunit
MDIFFEVVGWAGTVVILTGYFLLSIGRIPNGRLYQWLNLAGAIGLLVNGAFHAAWPSAILNVVWSGIALFALVQLVRKRRTNSTETASADSAII